MIDIFDEVGYVKEILEHGFSDRWERDALLLARYYRSIGMKKSEAKINIKEKAERYVPSYRKYKDYPRANKMVDVAYRKDTPLREIREIKVPKATVTYLLKLEKKFTISEIQAKQLKKERSLKVTEFPLNFNRVKFLFTLYMWTRIQEFYLDKPNMHYLRDYTRRFKHDAKLGTGFSVSKEKDLLYDLGFLYVNNAQGIDCTFIKNTPEIACGCGEWIRPYLPNGVVLEKIREQYQVDKEYYIITGEDLYNPGEWLEKQKFGCFVCQRCGKEFAHYNGTKQEKGRKYCKECAKAVNNHKQLNDTRIIHCIDCGKEVEISNKNHKTIRCEECQKLADKKKSNSLAN